MHIVFLTHHFPGPAEAGAPRPWQFAKYFSQRGHQVTVLAAGYDYMSGERTADDAWGGRLWAEHASGLDGVRCYRTWALAGYKKSVLRRMIAYTAFSVLSFFKCLGIRDIDVVLTPNNPPSNALFGYILAKLKRAKFVEEIREPHPEIDVALGYFQSSWAQWVFKSYHDFFHRRNDLLISLTPGITRIMKDRGVDPSLILEVPNAYDRENDRVLHEHSADEAKRQVGWNGQFVVLYAGSHGLVPQLQILLEAADCLRDYDDIRFVLIGEGDHKQRYQEFAAERDLKNCLFLPGQPRSEMPLYYRAADTCTHLIPKGSFWNCILPNKVFDYLGSGNPTIFSGAGDTADLIRTADAGLVVAPEDPQAFADAVLELYRNPSRRAEMGTNARDYVLSHFSRDELMGKLEQSLLELT